VNLFPVNEQIQCCDLLPFSFNNKKFPTDYHEIFGRVGVGAAQGALDFGDDPDDDLAPRIFQRTCIK